MRFLFKAKDGGPESPVTGYWLFESKSFGSIALLRFGPGVREAYHSHAFNSINWILSGRVMEDRIESIKKLQSLTPSLKPFIVTRDNLHKVFALGKPCWMLAFRGPWARTWEEVVLSKNERHTLASGRVIIAKKALTKP